MHASVNGETVGCWYCTCSWCDTNYCRADSKKQVAAHLLVFLMLHSTVKGHGIFNTGSSQRINWLQVVTRPGSYTAETEKRIISNPCVKYKTLHSSCLSSQMRKGGGICYSSLLNQNNYTSNDILHKKQQYGYSCLDRLVLVIQGLTDFNIF